MIRLHGGLVIEAAVPENENDSVSASDCANKSSCKEGEEVCITLSEFSGSGFQPFLG